MILITLGTQDKDFTRLLKKVDELIDKKIIKEEVVVQAGYTKYKSKNMKVFDYVSKKKLEKLMDESSYIITHAGVGSIFDCLKKNKKVIAASRLSKYNEHTNDHQLEIVSELGKDKMIIPVVEMDELEDAVKSIKKFKPNKYVSNNEKMVKLISDYIDQNERDDMKSLFNKYREIIMYLIFGVLTTVVSLIIYYLLVYTVLNPDNAFQLQLANVLSWVAGVTFAYVTNRSMVFKSENKNRLKEAGSFVAARVITLLMDMVIMFIGVTALHGNDKILKLVSQVVVVVSNYIFSKLFVFKK